DPPPLARRWWGAAAPGLSRCRAATADCVLPRVCAGDTMNAPIHEFLEREDLIGDIASGPQMARRGGVERELATLPPYASPMLHSLLKFWTDAGGSGNIPDRSQLDAMTLRPWLGHVSIYEAIPGTIDFRIRLEGTA